MNPHQLRRIRVAHHPRHAQLLVISIAITAAVAIAAVWGIAAVLSGPTPKRTGTAERGGASVILAADGTRIGYVPADTVREPVSGSELPQDLKDATVAIEDRGFWDHGAIDPESIARAAIENISAGHIVQGGSTITQQLAKNLYISNPHETLARKLREARIAIQLESDHTKRWILDQYLNSIPYGTNGGITAVGAQAAAQTYFGRSVDKLSLPRLALLAGLPQAPSEYDPMQHPWRARERRNEVLTAMYQQGYITQSEYQHASRTPLGLDPGDRYTKVRDPYFFDYVEGRLIDRYGVNTVRNGGLIVKTTLDPALQAAAQQAVTDGAARLGGPSAALVATEVGTGRVLAMAASTDPTVDQFNIAADGHRQPGSSFKPFVLATALSQGIDPDTTYYDGSDPVTLYPYGPAGEAWTVHNAEPGQGRMSITQATTDSVNAVYAQLALDVGPQNVADMAKSLGITSPLDGVPAEAIGGLRVGVSPLEMSNAYSSFADGGVHHPVRVIDSVARMAPSGRPVQKERFPAAAPSRALPKDLAAEETRVLETVIQSGTGTAADIGCPAAGKTGTTDGQTDAWFVGYTPQIAAAVWTGYPDARTSMDSSAFGGTYAAPIWHEFMAAAGGDCSDFPWNS